VSSSSSDCRYKRPEQTRAVHYNESVRNIGQIDARHRKYKRRKHGGGQAYDRSSDYTAIVAEATRNRP
jgi:hypothetical protein